MSNYEGTQVPDLPAAGGAISLYTVVYESTTILSAGAGADQAATQQLQSIGVYYGNQEGAVAAVSGDTVDVRVGPMIRILAGTGGFVRGEELVVENGTGKVLGVTTGSVTKANGDRIIGVALSDTAADDLGFMTWAPYTVDGLA